MIKTRPLFDFTADVAAPQVTPDGPYGTRRFIPVTGGSFEGERRKAKGPAIARRRRLPADPSYDWLNRIIGIGTGERRADTVLISVHELL